jgi:hypothetical protein
VARLNAAALHISSYHSIYVGAFLWLGGGRFGPAR